MRCPCPQVDEDPLLGFGGTPLAPSVSAFGRSTSPSVASLPGEEMFTSFARGER